MLEVIVCFLVMQSKELHNIKIFFKIYSILLPQTSFKDLEYMCC